jgi:hypothetical protein
MSIGLPFIGTNVPNDIHDVVLSDSITLRVHTSDDTELETGGSLWFAGKQLSYKKFPSFTFEAKNNSILYDKYKFLRAIITVVLICICIH